MRSFASSFRMIVDVRRDGISWSEEFTLEIAAWESKVLIMEIQPPMAAIGGSFRLEFGVFRLN